MSDILATDLITALYEDAGREGDADRADQLRRDADSLKDIWNRSKYARASTRDQMTVALGNASLNLAETLSEVARELYAMRQIVGDMHTHVQHNDTLVSMFIESFTPFQAEARAAWEGSAQQIKKLDTRLGVVERTITARPKQRKLEHDQLVAIQSDIASQVRSIGARLDADEQRLDRKRDELDAMHVWQAIIEERLAELERHGDA